MIHVVIMCYFAAPVPSFWKLFGLQVIAEHITQTGVTGTLFQKVIWMLRKVSLSAKMLPVAKELRYGESVKREVEQNAEWNDKEKRHPDRIT